MCALGRGRPKTGKPPHRPGVYALVDPTTGDWDYVGETSDLSARRSQHSQDKGRNRDFVFYETDGRSTPRSRRDYEKQCIDKYSPPLNQRAGGAGRYPD